MANFFEYVKVAMIFAKGILGLRKKEYRLNFVYVPEDRLWYIDMPWPGDRYNLAMVAGSDKMLDRLCEEEDGNYVTIDVRPRRKREEHPGFYECVQTKSSLLGGSYYEVHGPQRLQSHHLDLSCHALRPWPLSQVHLCQESRKCPSRVKCP